MSLPYSQKVLEYFMHPKNVGEIENSDAMATEGSPACGDMVRLYLKVNPETKVIEDIKFKSYGCASNIATASIITELAKGKTIDEAKKITWKKAADALGGLPPIKVHCAVLAVDALKTAIENYEHKYGLIKEKKPTDENVIEERLKHVINPLTGLDVLRVSFIKNFEIKNGIIKIYLNLDSDHQLANNIREEIKDRLEPLWDVKEVKVFFNDLTTSSSVT
ncbi:iron-sulfur cluster assembly scaffold protein [Patescibacteria group bacterium]|nr:iron-sulfur cluster assembly scaffold protein [Patescibacteria group bacterium]